MKPINPLKTGVINDMAALGHELDKELRGSEVDEFRRGYLVGQLRNLMSMLVLVEDTEALYEDEYGDEEE